MRVKLENPVLLTRVVEIISELVTEVRIKIDERGMSITAMDPANVSIVNFKISKNAFSQFEVGNEILGINLENLKQILKRCGAVSSLILEKEENLLKILIQDKIKRNFTLNLIEVESEDINFEEKISNHEIHKIHEKFILVTSSLLQRKILFYRWRLDNCCVHYLLLSCNSCFFVVKILLVSECLR